MNYELITKNTELEYNMSQEYMKKRSSGLLMHITSLPSKYGIGDFGPEAYRFADFLVLAKQKLWQVLPLNQTTLSTGNSPYNCLSAFAGNTKLISPEMLVSKGLLTKSEIECKASFTPGKVNFHKVTSYKNRLFELAYQRFKKLQNKSDYELFCRDNSYWLDEYAEFVSLRKRFGLAGWNQWPRKFRDKNEKVTAENDDLRHSIGREKFLQFIFYQQWLSLKRYCNEHGIEIIGDIPMYVAYDSADVWSHPEIFKLGKNGKPTVVAGVPPDYFSNTGQLWGNPVYNWQYLKKDNYNWWVRRFRHNLRLFDIVRIDHFRGFVAYWEVPARAKTARSGRWVKGPGAKLLNCILSRLPRSAIIVEDLGYITPDVREFIRRFDLTCMKVLLFAFDGRARNLHLPHRHIENCVVYTGTHDNNTVRGWFEGEAKNKQKQCLFKHIGRTVLPCQVHHEFIRLAMASVARMAVIPVQDILGLGRQAKMNRPATKRGNWKWRLTPGRLTNKIAQKLAEVTRVNGRA